MKMVIVALAGFVVFILSLLVINRFFFSWTGLISSKLGLCEYRSVMVPGFNGGNKKLGQRYDIPRIASAMRVNRNYQVGGHNGEGIVVSRDFGGVKYNITFEEHDGVSEFNLNTYNFDGYPSGSVAGGERCTTPSYVIERNVHLMIDDLPLSDSQKSELKRYVVVTYTLPGRSFF